MNVVALPSTRRHASQRRRAPQIMEAAARVFAERGFHGATTQDIADVLGIKQASLYYYFSSKEAALELVCLRGVEGFFEAAKAIAARPESARKRLALLINSHLSPLVDRADFVKVFLNERQHLPTESRRRIGRWSRGLERIFEEVIKEGIAKGEFRKAPEKLARSSRWKTGPGKAVAGRPVASVA
jgi:AcrR family transcriptional regulator